jgi:hypothetical protein
MAWRLLQNKSEVITSSPDRYQLHEVLHQSRCTAITVNGILCFHVFENKLSSFLSFFSFHNMAASRL